MDQRRRTVYLLAVMLSLLCAFPSLAKPRSVRRLAPGAWGGPQIKIDAVQDGATIEYACATGTIVGPLRLNSKGGFSWTGFHRRERGGPVRLNENASQRPAIYTGWVKGATMKLTVKLDDTGETLGTFTLQRGARVRIFKCR